MRAVLLEKMSFLIGVVLCPWLLISIPVIKDAVSFAETYARGEYLTVAGAAVCSLLLVQLWRVSELNPGLPTAIYILLLVSLIGCCIALFAGRLNDDGVFKTETLAVAGREVDASVALLVVSVVAGLLAPPQTSTISPLIAAVPRPSPRAFAGTDGRK